MLARFFLVFALFLVSVPRAEAIEPAAAWPSSAQGRPLPRPSWIMVVPARRLPGGGLSIWEREDPWVKAWRVPRTVQGLRIVTLFGDADDRRSITAGAIDGMMVDSLNVVMRKYGAPAIALAVTNGSSVAMAAWVPGWSASWEPVEATEDLAVTRERSIAALSSMLQSGSARVPSPDQVVSASILATITSFRVRGDGGIDYRVVLSGPRVDDAVEQILRLPNVSVGVEDRQPDGLTVIVGQDAGALPLEQGFRSLGFVVR